MRIIEGDFSGKSGQIIKGVLSGAKFQISTGLISSTEYKIPSEISTIKLLSKDERRTFAQLLVALLVGITIVGIPIAILIMIVWKKIDFTVGVKTKDGKKFIARGDTADWKTVKGYIGLGSLDSF